MIVDKNNPLPLYHQIKNHLMNQIKDEKLQEREKLPSEPEMMKTFDVSRSTVRKALGELEKEGYVEKFHGKGTIVCRPKITPLAALTSFSQNMRAAGLTPTYETKEIDICSPPLNIANFFEIDPDQDNTTIFMKRVLLADLKPIAIQQVYLPINLIHSIQNYFTKEYLDSHSMYKLLEDKLGISLWKAEEDISAIQAGDEEKELLHLDSQIPLLLINRKTYDENKNAIEYARLTYRADLYSYKFNLLAK